MSDIASALREPWESLPAQRQAATFGIWIFLVSEMLFFGAIFLTYGYVRILHPDVYAEASSHTDIVFGTVNTAIILTSSLTMALAARAADVDVKGVVVACLGVTALLGLAFLVVKGFEYRKDIVDHLVPGAAFALRQPAAQIFFSFYWAVTITHVVHLSIGIVLVARLAIEIFRGRVAMRSPQLEVTALYWGLVDIVWVILYPLIYLNGRAA